MLCNITLCSFAHLREAATGPWGKGLTTAKPVTVRADRLGT